MTGGDRTQGKEGHSRRIASSLSGHKQSSATSKFVPRNALPARGGAAKEVHTGKQLSGPTTITTLTVQPQAQPQPQPPPHSSSSVRLMVNDILGALGLERVSLRETEFTSPPVTLTNKFTKISYLFDVSSASASRLLPQIITHGVMDNKLGNADTVPPGEYDLVRALLLQRPARPKIDESAVDIFEEAGADYQFKPRANEDSLGRGPASGINLIEFASLREGGVHTTSIIPESVESILQTAAVTAEGSTDEDDPAYLIMGYDYNDGDDDEDAGFFSSATTSSTARLSKRQKLRRDGQKLEKQVRQVAKLMEKSSSKHDEGR